MVFGATEVDHLGSDVGAGDEAVNLEFAVFGDGDFGDLGKVAAVAEVERKPCSRALGELLGAPARFLGGEFQDVTHPGDIVGRAGLLAFGAAGRSAGGHFVVGAEDFESEFERIAAAGMGELVDEAVEDPRENAAAGSAPRAHWPTGVEHRLVGLVVGDPTAWKLVGAERTTAAGTAALAEGEEVVLPRDHFALGIDAALQEVQAAGTILVVFHVIFARPRELHGRVHLLGDRSGLDEVVGADAAAETPAGAVEMQNDFLGRDAEHAVHHAGADGRDLRG